MQQRFIRLAMLITLVTWSAGYSCSRQVKEDTAPPVTTVEGPAGPIHIDDGGSGGVPVLFIHSFGGDTAHWTAQLEHLRPARRAVAMDLRGHGQSAPPADDAWKVGDFANDIDAVVNDLGAERVVLVGHSIGAAAALEYAGHHADKVAGLVLVGPPGKIPPEQAGPIVQAIEANYDTVMNVYWDKLLTNAQPKVNEQVRTGVGHLSKPVSLSIIRGAFEYDPLPALGAYAGPKLVVVSAEEEQNPAALYNLTPNLPHKVIPGTSHWVHMDKPEEFNRILDEFLAQISS
jgi:pimeloyl-ACP methyl ester carboxylesterase